MGNGDVTHCDDNSHCKIVSTGHKFPNGLLMSSRNEPRYLYVPSAHEGGITVYSPKANSDLDKVDHIDIPYPIDNLSEDADGVIWAPAFPKALQVLEMYEDPLNVVSASTVFRVRRKTSGDGGWEVEKVLEDARGEVLPGATVVIHDAKTGRMFLSGVISPFITVCDPKK